MIVGMRLASMDLPEPGGPIISEIVSARDGDLDGAFDVLLAFHVGEIDVVILVRLEKRGQVLLHRFELLFAVEELERLAQIGDAINVDALDDRRLAGIRCGNEKRFLAAAPCFERDGQHASHGAHCAGEREFSDERKAGGVCKVVVFSGGDHAERDGEVEAGAFLFHIGGREIDRRAPARPEIAAVADRRRHAVLAFLHGGVGQANHDDDRTSASRIDFDFDLERIDAIDRRRINFSQHPFNFSENRRDEKHENRAFHSQARTRAIYDGTMGAARRVPRRGGLSYPQAPSVAAFTSCIHPSPPHHIPLPQKAE